MAPKARKPETLSRSQRMDELKAEMDKLEAESRKEVEAIISSVADSVGTLGAEEVASLLNDGPFEGTGWKVKYVGQPNGKVEKEIVARINNSKKKPKTATLNKPTLLQIAEDVGCEGLDAKATLDDLLDRQIIEPHNPEKRQGKVSEFKLAK